LNYNPELPTLEDKKPLTIRSKGEANKYTQFKKPYFKAKKKEVKNAVKIPDIFKGLNPHSLMSHKIV